MKFLGYLDAPLSTSESDSQQWVGFHGTSFSAACQILADKFRTSNGDEEWLGHGVYFFIEGLNDPVEKATGWAKKRAWERNRKRYDDFAVIRTDIHTAMCLDLDAPEDQAIFESVRASCTERMKKEGISTKTFAMQNDCYLANFAMETLGLDALVRKESILTERFQFKSRLPNCRIMCVKDPVKCIQEKRIIAKGKV
ncbi:TPA: hypothetical protein ACXIJW_002336 [Serratia marcescens]|jgi:hypothetical protein